MNLKLRTSAGWLTTQEQRKFYPPMKIGKIWEFLIVFVASLSLCAGTAKATSVFDILITEVAFDESSGEDIVELFNPTDEVISLTNLILTDLDGVDTTFATDAADLGAGHFALIRFGGAAGTTETASFDSGDLNNNGILDIFTTFIGFTATEDEAVLGASSLDSQAPDVSKIIDAVVWTQNDGGVPVSEINDFAAISPEVFGSVVDYSAC